MPKSIQLDYLLDAVDFVGTTMIKVWGTAELEPLCFTAVGAKTIREANRLAAVMPFRV